MLNTNDLIKEQMVFHLHTYVWIPYSDELMASAITITQ